MGYPTSRVDAPGLASIGAAVERTAPEFAASRDELAPAGPLHGWASGPTLMATGSSWTTFLGNLTHQVRTLGADLRHTAETYHATDTDSAHRLSHAAGRQSTR